MFAVCRNVAAVIGLMVEYTAGVEFGAAHYTFLETDKIKAMRKNKGDFEKQMWISKEGKEDIYWWLDNLNNPKLIRSSDPDLELFTEASLLGWGVHTETLQTGGKVASLGGSTHKRTRIKGNSIWFKESV